MESLHPAATGRIGTMNPDASGKFPHGEGDHGGGRARDLLFSVVALSVGKLSASVGLVHGEAVPDGSDRAFIGVTHPPR